MKGFAFEREVVQAFKVLGLPARRFWGSDGRSAGFPEKADLEACEETYQLKRLKKLPVLLNIPPDITGYICRGDGQKAVAVVPLDYLIQLLKEGHAGPTVRSPDPPTEA